MEKTVLLSLILTSTFAVAFSAFAKSEQLEPLRPPAVPLIVMDPFTSYWSPYDNLYDGPPQHWTGSEMGMIGMIRIDGTAYRFMGNDMVVNDVATMRQINVTVYPTQTVYVFQQSGVQLTLIFSSPGAQMEEKKEFVGLPVTFVSFKVQSIDGMNHKVELYYDNTAEGTVSDTSTKVSWERVSLMPGEMGMKIGSTIQEFGTADRINWGYWYLTMVLSEGVETAIQYSDVIREIFVGGFEFPMNDIEGPAVPCVDDKLKPVLAVHWDLETVTPTPTMRYLRVFYEQEYAISYFGTMMKPLWRHMYGNFRGVFRQLDYEASILACDQFDAKVVEALYTVGGKEYASISSLAWRQAVGGLTAVWNNNTKTSWIFLKEISSDGDVSTVDVLFPASPLYLWANPESLKKMLIPLLDYSMNLTGSYGLRVPYNLSWAPHHLGRWPVCDLLPTKQENMPVEESGNMLMMLAAIVKMQNNNVTFLKPYWGLLKTWATFIADSLPDPGYQLCTDDFEGASPNNTNLAVKGVVGLASYLYMVKLHQDYATIGCKPDNLKLFNLLNSNFVDFWHRNSYAPPNIALGESVSFHTRQFNLSNSWSLKYNLLFQRILGTTDFSDETIQAELDFYNTKMLPYGIPLDDRHTYTKTDWLMWTAALAKENMFQDITSKVFNFANKTPDRVPFTDWYDVGTGNRQGGFRARPVIGGLFARMLTNPVDKKIIRN